MKSNKYVLRIVKIILLTNIPLIISIFTPNREWVGISYVLGSIAGVIGFVWHAFMLSGALTMSESVTKTRAIKGFYLRHAAIVLYAIIIAYLFRGRLNIIWFGLGLLSAQIAIYIDLAWGIVKKYLRIE